MITAGAHVRLGKSYDCCSGMKGTLVELQFVDFDGEKCSKGHWGSYLKPEHSVALITFSTGIPGEVERAGPKR